MSDLKFDYGKYGRKVVIDGAPVQMTMQGYLLFMALWNARGRWLDRNEMQDALGRYLSPSNITTHIFCIRTALRPTLFRIENGFCRYRLVRVPAQAMAA
jgi:DNA-binding winged helix-turn-helix (wHTH) protein